MLFHTPARLYVFLVMILLPGLVSRSQQVEIPKDSIRKAYILKYSELAVAEMRKSGIPASITMAQAILESNIGRSPLATEANNHFGIKCHLTWDGDRYFYDDDSINECFRSYKNPEESFLDHSVFLMTRERYSFLFNLDPLDYKSWAKGLKSAGYATNPNYAEILIRIIEEESLYHLDNWMPPVISMNSTGIKHAGENDMISHRPTTATIPPHYTRNRIDFVIAGEAETVESLTHKYDMLKWEIRKYNEMDDDEEIIEGTIVYLQPKRRKAARGFEVHYVKEGETVYSISQHFGIKTSWLLKRNSLQEGDSLFPGQRLYLRGRK